MVLIRTSMSPEDRSSKRFDPVAKTYSMSSSGFKPIAAAIALQYSISKPERVPSSARNPIPNCDVFTPHFIDPAAITSSNVLVLSVPTGSTGSSPPVSSPPVSSPPVSSPPVSSPPVLSVVSSTVVSSASSASSLTQPVKATLAIMSITISA